MRADDLVHHHLAARFQRRVGVVGALHLGVKVPAVVVERLPGLPLCPDWREVIAARELNPSGLPGNTWENRHLAYTHGYAAAFAPGFKLLDLTMRVTARTLLRMRGDLRPGPSPPARRRPQPRPRKAA